MRLLFGLLLVLSAAGASAQTIDSIEDTTPTNNQKIWITSALADFGTKDVTRLEHAGGADGWIEQGIPGQRITNLGVGIGNWYDLPDDSTGGQTLGAYISSDRAVTGSNSVRTWRRSDPGAGIDAFDAVLEWGDDNTDFTEIYASVWWYFEPRVYAPCLPYFGNPCTSGTVSCATQLKIYRISELNRLSNICGSPYVNQWWDIGGTLNNQIVNPICNRGHAASACMDAYDEHASATWTNSGQSYYLAGEYDLDDVAPMRDAWYRIEIYAKRETSIGADDGVMMMRFQEFDETKKQGFHFTSWNTVEDANCGIAENQPWYASGDGAWNWLIFQNSFDRSCQAQGEDALFYHDDMYVSAGTGSTALARVEIGNRSTYADCTILHPLDIEEWHAAGDSIQVVWDLGPHNSPLGSVTPADSLVLYVTNASDVTGPSSSLVTSSPTCDDCVTNLQFVGGTGRTVTWPDAINTDALNPGGSPTNSSRSVSGPDADGHYTEILRYATGLDSVEITRTSSTVLPGGAFSEIVAASYYAASKAPEYLGSATVARQPTLVDGVMGFDAFWEWCYKTGDCSTLDLYTVKAMTRAASPDWSYKKTITADTSLISGTNTDFPMLVLLTEADHSDIFDNANSDGSDIRFTKGDGTTSLPFEMVSYDSSAGFAEFWVMADTLSDNVNDFEIKYGNASATALENGNIDVFKNYEYVFHFEADTPVNGGVIADSSPNQLNGRFTQKPGPDGGLWDESDHVAGIIGKAYRYEGSEVTRIHGGGQLTGRNFVLSGLMLHERDDTNFFIHANPCNFRISGLASQSSPEIMYAHGVYFGQDAGCLTPQNYRYYRDEVIKLDTWYYYVFVFDGDNNTITVYVNGQAEERDVIVEGGSSWEGFTGLSATPRLSFFGSRDGDDADNHYGLADEARASDGLKAGDADWISTEYNNMTYAIWTDGNSFFTFGDQEAN